MDPKKALQKAITIAGGQAPLARELGVKQQNVWWWLHKANAVPAKFVIPIEKLTGIPRRQLRPDVFSEGA